MRVKELRKVQSNNILFYRVIVLLSSLLASSVHGRTECNETSECAELLRNGSECIDGYCSNPFQKGCLRTILGEERFPKLRTCNSEDPIDSHGILCNPTIETYQEIRILSQNWESAMFQAWLYQIVLSELLDIPTTIETGTETAHLNFYDSNMPFDYGKSNLWDAIKNAYNNDNNCIRVMEKNRQANNNNEEEDHEYIPCAHVNPEVWNNRMDELRVLEKDGYIESPEGSGMIAQLSWFIPKFTAERDQSFSVFPGLVGEHNRRRLAERFHRPTTWIDYCHHVSATNCSSSDSVATRYPQTFQEQSRFFVSGLFKGYFRKTDENNCDLFPNNCTGHISDFPCSWKSHLKQQSYHNQIFVESSGNVDVANGYTYQQLVDMWDAANATKSDVLFYWWTPEALYQKYLGTDAELLKVVLPPPSQHCIDNRIASDDRCNIDPMVQVGSADGSCDDSGQILMRIVLSSLYSQIYEDEPNEAKRSPSYDAIKAFRINELQIGQMFDYWTAINIDKWNYDPREAVCRWAVENIDYLQTFIPRNHPRTFVPTNIYEDERGLFLSALAFGCISLVLVVITTVMTYQRRKRKVMVYAKVSFLFILLLGLLLVSCGSILLALEPTNLRCQMTNWFLLLGYTLELVPLIVKVAALQKLMGAAKRMRRITINEKSLFGAVFFMCLLAILFLIGWTIIDPSEVHHDLELTDEMAITTTTTNGTINSNDNETTPTVVTSETTIVLIHSFCKSYHDYWRYMGVMWHAVLLICATVLAFQTRDIKHVGFNESQLLAFMIYSHFMFVLLRLITFMLESIISEYHLVIWRSYIYSIDAIICILIYFVPKLITLDDDLNNSGIGRFRVSRYMFNNNNMDIARMSTMTINTTNHNRPSAGEDHSSTHTYSQRNMNDSFAINSSSRHHHREETLKKYGNRSSKSEISMHNSKRANTGEDKTFHDDDDHAIDDDVKQIYRLPSSLLQLNPSQKEKKEQKPRQCQSSKKSNSTASKVTKDDVQDENKSTEHKSTTNLTTTEVQQQTKSETIHTEATRRDTNCSSYKLSEMETIGDDVRQRVSASANHAGNEDSKSTKIVSGQNITKSLIDNNRVTGTTNSGTVSGTKEERKEKRSCFDEEYFYFN